MPLMSAFIVLVSLVAKPNGPDGTGQDPSDDTHRSHEASTGRSAAPLCAVILGALAGLALLGFALFLCAGHSRAAAALDEEVGSPERSTGSDQGGTRPVSRFSRMFRSVPQRNTSGGSAKKYEVGQPPTPPPEAPEDSARFSDGVRTPEPLGKVSATPSVDMAPSGSTQALNPFLKLTWRKFAPTFWRDPQGVRDLLLYARHVTSMFEPGGALRSERAPAVFDASDRSTPMIIKRYSLTSVTAARCFYTEVRALTVVSHPNIMRVLGYSADSEYGYVLAEAADSGNLRDWTQPVICLRWNPVGMGPGSALMPPPAVVALWSRFESSLRDWIRARGHISGYSSFQLWGPLPHEPNSSFGIAATSSILQAYQKSSQATVEAGKAAGPVVPPGPGLSGRPVFAPQAAQATPAAGAGDPAAAAAAAPQASQPANASRFRLSGLPPALLSSLSLPVLRDAEQDGGPIYGAEHLAASGIIQGLPALSLEIRVGVTTAAAAISLDKHVSGQQVVELLERSLNALPYLSLVDRLRAVRDVWAAAHYLHSGLGDGSGAMLHHEIVPSSVLLRKGASAVLGDFSMSRIDTAFRGRVQTKASQTAHVDPVLFAPPPDGDYKQVYGPQNDVYSLGVMIKRLFDQGIPLGAGGLDIGCIGQDFGIPGLELERRIAIEIRSSLLSLAHVCMEHMWTRRPTSDMVLMEINRLWAILQNSGIMPSPASHQMMLVPGTVHPALYTSTLARFGYNLQ